MNTDKFDKNRIVVFDVETTGLSAKYDEMLQFSCCDGTGKKLLNTYIHPIRCKAWPEAEAINGITPETVVDAPTVANVREQIQKIFDQAEVLVSYNGNFDVGFLKAAGINPYSHTRESYDVMLAFAPIYGEWNDYFGDYKWQKLTTAAAYFGYDWKEHGAHDSMGDVLATLFVFDRLTEKAVRYFAVGEKFFDRMEELYTLCEDPSASLPEDLTLSLDDLQPPCISLSKSTCYILDGFYHLYGRRIDNDTILRALLQSVDFIKWSESKAHSELASMKLRDLNNPDSDMKNLLPEYRTTEDMEWFEDLDRLPPLSSGNSIFISWELKEILDDLEEKYDLGCIEGAIRHTHVPQSVIVGKMIRDMDLEKLEKAIADQTKHEDPYRIKVACEYFRMGGLDISERS